MVRGALVNAGRDEGLRHRELVTRHRLAFAVALVLGVALIVALYTLTRQANARAVSSQNAALHAKDQTIRTLSAQLRAHGITPAVSPIPGVNGQPGASGVNGRNGVNGVGVPGRNGLNGRNGVNGNNGLNGTQPTPIPGPVGSPGAAGQDGATGTPGPAGSPGAEGPAGPDQCTWQDDPLRPGTQTCTRPSPTPEGTP